LKIILLRTSEEVFSFSSSASEPFHLSQVSSSSTSLDLFLLVNLVFIDVVFVR